ncbi:MAG: polyketide cyclase [Rhodospirillales bacterium]|nr:polyketide cyclase [Rhodospirillales bacterium]
MSNRSVTHSTFVIERRFDASPARVFNAFADPQAKARWFSGPPEWGPDISEMDFRVGGRETNRGGAPGGPVHSFDATYQDIVPNERIVFTYDMHLDDVRISVSLTTIELTPDAGGTRLKFTEQGAFLDAFDKPALREEGTKGLLDALEASLKPDH